MKLVSNNLRAALDAAPPARILEKIHACLDEDEQYAADELVELAEEILNQLAAVGMAHYIRKAPQKEVYNDFLVQLFNSSGHDYNAGPLYRWSANMNRECPDFRSSVFYRYFWEEVEGREVLCRRVHHLAELRNAVMHGFFVLPPEKNREEAEAIGELLLDLVDSGLFKKDIPCHFLGNDGFTGNWNIHDQESWNAYISNRPFGKLCARIVAEQQGDYWDKETKIFSYADDTLVPDELKTFIQKNTHGALACWVHPNDTIAPNRFAAIGNWIRNQPEVRFVGYTLNETGISYTGSFLIARLLQVLNDKGSPLSKNKKPEQHLKDLRKGCKEKIVVAINGFHLALFSPQHVSALTNLLFENDILLMAMGHHYEHFNSFFNQSFTISHPTAVPDVKEQPHILRNYLRFKGPSADKSDEVADVQKLEEILALVVNQLQQGRKIFARRFADEMKYDIEYVHEIFAVLHPWVNTTREAFEEDTVDELYGFPTHHTEVTPIYLALGRRDVKLEYQHKVISL
jgi:hypothetical protein